jgi:alkylated DNA repair protein (DNA oxidative demethylase)
MVYEVIFQLPLETQIELLDICRQLVQEAPLFQKTMPTGANFKYLCTSAGAYGWLSDRKGYRYETAHPITKHPFPPIPKLIHDISVDAAEQCGLSIRPETALINWYAADGTLGLHQDKTEECDAPVVSISLGDDCLFIKGGEQRNSPKETITLHSGDVFVMGGAERFYYHGVKKILPETALAALGMKQAGRVNITVRQVYE